MKWIEGHLKEGQIIRVKCNNPEAKDGHIYGRASGGFGMSKATLGSALFVENEAFSYEECKNKTSKDEARWSKYWDIEVEK